MTSLKPLLGALLASLVLGAGVATAEPATRVEVFKSPQCGCCGKWVEHLRKSGFEVTTRDIDNVPAMRKSLGMPDEYGSCHTARIGRYLVEGHVPAQDIRRLLKENPDATGLAAPGMPQGSPGMETGIKQTYDTLLVRKDGSATVFERH